MDQFMDDRVNLNQKNNIISSFFFNFFDVNSVEFELKFDQFNQIIKNLIRSTKFY
jgi:hypothetical protein